ncbi:hypothetical protein B6N60_01534 [Richelia sinica FACHB-800]|uniref:FecR protein domain-containing protein n=2 Tax=Richelia TaxID=98443 RepID=A0A975T610_9NOST|nr:hypothetical protein [Richelia sinica]QXE22848.1 hypothetical protein B6N60_01534 [Richelia sinica FACHB-800]
MKTQAQYFLPTQTLIFTNLLSTICFVPAMKHPQVRKKSDNLRLLHLIIGLLIVNLDFFAVNIGVFAAPDPVLTKAEVYKLIKVVELLLPNQTTRLAKLKDVVIPRDAVKTGASSEAQLFFNDKSLIRVDQSSIFRFAPGLRRFQLPNRLALNEMIFTLENGTALILSPPGSVGTAVETPESKIRILAPSQVSSKSPELLIAANKNNQLKLSSNDLLSPANKASAVMVIHDAASHNTQIFALTDGDIKISDQQEKKTVALKGGQTVAVQNGLVGTVQEFDLQGFYKLISLASGLGPGQENLVAQEAQPVQETINAIRIQTLAALKNQTKRFEGFTRTFLSDALDGTEGDLNPRPQATVRIINPQVTTGTFIRRRGNTAVFIPDNANFTNNNQQGIRRMQVDFQAGTANVDGNTGIANQAGLNGNNATVSVINSDGQITQIDVFAVNGEQPKEGTPYRGSLTTGIARDR